MNKRMIIILLLTLLVFGGLFAGKWYGQQMMSEYLNTMAQAPVTVSSTEAKVALWQQQVSAVGTLSAIQGADLTAEVSGIVDSIRFENGAEVKAGAIIASINSATDRAELASLEAQVRLAELERDRVAALWQRKSIAKSMLDKQQTELEQAEALVAAQRARIEQKLIRAPFTGRLGIRQINVGQYVAAGDPVIALQSLDPLYLNFTLPEERYTQVHVGQRVEALVDALDGKAFAGEITAIEPSIEQSTHNFDVQATLANKTQVMRPGMFTRIHVNLGEPSEKIIIPRTAISFNPYGNSVFLLTPGDDGQLIAQQRFIQTGEERGDVVAVNQGLAVGEMIATSGLLKLRNGSIVSLNNTVQPEASVSPVPHNE